MLCESKSLICGQFAGGRRGEMHITEVRRVQACAGKLQTQCDCDSPSKLVEWHISDSTWSAIQAYIRSCPRGFHKIGLRLKGDGKKGSERNQWPQEDMSCFSYRKPNQCKTPVGWRREAESSHYRRSSQTAGRCRVHPVPETGPPLAVSSDKNYATTDVIF